MLYKHLTDQAILDAHPNVEHKFKLWKRAVDAVCKKHFLMSSESMPDASWRYYFNSSLTAKEAVESAVEWCWRYEPGIKQCYWGEMQ